MSRRAHRLLLATAAGLVGGASGSWQTIFDAALTTSNSGHSGRTLRQVIPASLISGVEGTKIRVTLQFGTAGAIVDKMYIGQAGAGDDYDFDGGQVQLFIDASASFNFTANTPQITDEATFTYDGVSDLVLALHFSGVSDIKFVAEASAATYVIAATDDAATTDASGYSLYGNVIASVDLIEVFG
jgi:hypothetical protein